MQKITIIIFILVLTGCTKDLVSKDYSEINPAIFPKSEEDVRALVNACYYPLRGAWWDGINGQTERGLIWMDCTTEMLAGKYGSQQKLGLLNYTPSDVEGVTYFYDAFYNKVSRMTLAIDQIQSSSVSDNIKKNAIAEIRCARGLLCYDLFDLYGPIVVAPLEVLKNPTVEKPLARLSNDEMVSFIEDDLAAAAGDLPEPKDAEYGRFNKALAKMIDIRLNLHEKKWDKVKTLCDDIMAYKQYSLDADYVGMWGLEGAKKSKEVIWAIPCNYEGTSESSWQMYALPLNFTPKGGYQTVQSTWWFYDSFEGDDVRKTMLITQYTGSDGIAYSRSNPGTVMDLGPIPLKVDQDAVRTTALSTVDVIVYRYADVLLSRAEAIANAGGAPTQEAMDLVNTIRHRAGLQNKLLADYISLDGFNDLILLERSHEFWCENGQYRADLIRHGKFLDHAELVKHTTYATPNKVVLPFSLKTVSEGKGKFIQNPGYN